MNTKTLIAALDEFGSCDIDSMDVESVNEIVRVTSLARSRLDAVEVRCARRRRRLASVGCADTTTSMFGRTARQSSKAAEQVDERAAAADALPSFEHDLVGGRISGSHLDAIASARHGLDGDVLAVFDSHETTLREHAHTDTVDAFARRCRQLRRKLVAAAATSDADELDRQRANSRIRRWTDKVTGMGHTHLELDPVRDAALWSIVDASVATRRQLDGNARTPWEQLKVDAFIAAMSGPQVDSAGDPSESASGDVHGRRVPEITVVIDIDTLRSGLHGSGVCETDDGAPLPVSTVRKMCCDAEVLPVVLGGDGVPLDVGRSSRTATVGQRRALRAIYRTCAHPDCTVPHSACRAHHIRWWWAHHGFTDLANLIPLCEKHHHLVHEGGWSIMMSDDRATTWIRPDGTIAIRGEPPDRTGRRDVANAADPPVAAHPGDPTSVRRAPPQSSRQVVDGDQGSSFTRSVLGGATGLNAAR